MQLTYPVSAEFDGKELLCLLRHLGLSATMIRRLKHSDGICIDGHSVTVRHRRTAGQMVTLTLPEPPSNVRPVAMDLEIVCEDDWLLVVNKPSGMPTHPSAGHREDTLINGLTYYLQNTPYTAHPLYGRLDPVCQKPRGGGRPLPSGKRGANRKNLLRHHKRYPPSPRRLGGPTHRQGRGECHYP